MLATARLLEQRATGHVSLVMAQKGISRLREAGSFKLRIPPRSTEAILINTAGGLAGGDDFKLSLTAKAGARLTVTSQSAERVYRTLGPPAVMTIGVTVQENASLHWLPRETILYDQSALTRTLDIDLATTARFLAVESLVFGREASGETITALSCHENWRIRQGGKLIHADQLHLDGALPQSPATLGGARAISTLVFISPEADRLVGHLTDAIGRNGGVSAWNGKLIARLVAVDGFELRKVLNVVLGIILGKADLPKTWSF
jgi:urease accessory protein